MVVTWCVASSLDTNVGRCGEVVDVVAISVVGAVLLILSTQLRLHLKYFFDDGALGTYDYE